MMIFKKTVFILHSSLFICFIPMFIGTNSSFSQPASYSVKDKKAIKYYEEALKYYDGKNSEAAKLYLDKAIKENENFIEAHTMLCYIYSDAGKPARAMESIQKAISINPDFYSGNFFTLAQLQFGLGYYEEAKKNFTIFLEKKHPNPEMCKIAERNISNCEFAAAAMNNPVPFNPVNMGKGINSQYDEYFPAITADEQTFLFTRKLPAKDNPYGWQEDFFISKKINSEWSPAVSISPKINSAMNEGAPCFSADGQFLFFVCCAGPFGYGGNRNGFGSCDIFYTYKSGTVWSAPENLGKPVNTSGWETQPSFSSDGKTLYFIRSIVSQNGVKHGDIFFSELNEKGEWSEPKSIGNAINTSGDEESVFIHPDNQTLYFSSDGHVGMGGIDIYMSRRQPSGEWGESVNLGYPINTTADENSLLISRDGKTAYFASDRKGGYGGLDMYYFELPENLQPGKTTYAKGKVFDAVTQLPLGAEIEVMDLKTAASVVKWNSNSATGEFLICLPVNREYAFNVSRDGYLFRSENFSFRENKDYEPIAINIPLTPIAKDSFVVLKNVFFETDKYDLKDESKAELNKLAEFLNKNKTLKIELSGHTDNVGDKKHNKTLSENRAKSVYNYLVANGIPAERLTFKGYGDSRPVVPNDSAEHRQMNRRTEFKVISK